MSQQSDKTVVVLGSGNGTNFQAIAEYIKQNGLPIKVLAVITDNPKAGIIQRGKNLGVPVKVLDYKAIGDKKLYNEMLLEALKELNPDLVVLAGYMRVLPPDTVNAFKGRIVNIHPALLPSFPGLNAIKQAWEHGVKVTGITVHYVDEGVDTGPIIAQVPVIIEDKDTMEELENKIHHAEHQLYPRVIRKILLGDQNNL